MSANSRLTLAIHTLTWIANNADNHYIATSERIAQSVNTNPVILRGLLGEMAKYGLVRVQRGNNAGWTLARKPEEITLLDVYRASRPSPLFAMHHTPPNPKCRIGHGIGPVLEEVYRDVQNSVEEQLTQITIADILQRTLKYTDEHPIAAQSAAT
ncbi:Rrf2 family protein [Thermosporothrix hazakensis]|jgi:Rrf2 family protein|uniref:Rrf2 family protein n=1 Tax=Thermosporothrix hazakensis TaxID=644383 RepID=A0A326UC00_THEHA|nr:Rrf2 family transcriptional regulator [Thermosporothrix hazakensis]PZW34328.1 Rrf2 family protein [Thermosporothrix hazakensis]GCE46122.1 Rrf2 family transcriptional regulator [Thermosporothrix hazakensis]